MPVVRIVSVTLCLVSIACCVPTDLNPFVSSLGGGYVTRPKISSVPEESAYVGKFYQYVVQTSLGNPESVEYLGGPSWLSLAGSRLSGTPTLREINQTSVVQIAVFFPGGMRSELRYPLTVYDSSLALDISSSAPTSVEACSAYSYQPVVVNASGRVVLSLEDAPAWLSVVNGTEVSGTPTEVDLGTTGIITLVASSANLNGTQASARQEFQVTVVATAQSFTSPTPPPTATEGVTYQHTFSLSQECSLSAPLFSLVDAPSWLSLNDFTMSGTPSVAEIGMSYMITATATYASGSVIEQAFSLSVEGAPAAPSAAGVWVAETPDPSTGIGTYSALCFDRSDAPHIFYSDDVNSMLNHATKNVGRGGQWTLETIDNNLAPRSPVSAAANGDVLHVVYFEEIGARAYDLKHATNQSGSWVASVIDRGFTSANGTTAIDVDATNVLHIVYGKGFDLIYGQLNGAATWQIETIDSGGAFDFQGPSLAVTEAGVVHISYEGSGGSLGVADGLRYISGSVGNWTAELVDVPGFVHNSSIAIDLNGQVHVAYDDFPTVKYATRNGAAWIVNDVGATGEYMSLSLDPTGVPFVLFNDDATGQLVYATNGTGNWVVADVDSNTVSDYKASAFDSTGQLHATYYDSVNQQLVYSSLQ